MTLGHLVAKSLGDEGFNLIACLAGEITANRASLELKLGPDNKVDDARIQAIWPVVVEDLVIVGILEWRAARNNRLSPLQALGENEVGDSAVSLGQLVGEGLVAAKLGGNALEALEGVGADNVADLIPCLDLVVRIRGRDDAEVLALHSAKELGAVHGALCNWHIDVPVGDGGNGAHDVLRVKDIWSGERIRR